ncbi:helix-turn-helix domain-containing protein [Streptomyces sioyaensis]|uniref:Helix-turn-helix domain-containing protein n=1 Tax=Streptomyces sioyaensis TaxID=67364 RepID=A0A4Q1QJH8_9ACTN|nr:MULTISPECIES: helix-turn-helix domain-containing protein [Streptomyces]MBM4793143.1 helix-turn-helix domain-containing protein [Streptomyces sioyaensis]RXS60033.1 helix-turn-helix domain-containing protein [Streptomyces sioyaensis]RXS72029.1 helix-turn-helix domain-containing protein [Streptomyces sp. TM32]
MSIGNSPEADRPSVGAALQKARIGAGLTVEEVSTTTRVRIPLVQAIEQDDFSRCGGDVYARGHIRALARAVSLDPRPLIDQFDAEHGGRPAPTPAAPLFEAERIRSEPRRPNWTAAMVAAIVAVVGFAGFTLFTGGDKSNGGSFAAGDNAKPAPAPTRHPSTIKPPLKPDHPEPSDSAVAGLPKDKVTIKVTARDGQSWISAKDANGKLLEDGLLKKGESKTITDKERIDLVLGNAGAVQLYVNGKEVKEIGHKGTVERLSYTPGDPQAG